MISALVLLVWQSFVASASQGKGGDCIQSIFHKMFFYIPLHGAWKVDAHLLTPFSIVLLAPGRQFCHLWRVQERFILSGSFSSCPLQSSFFLRHWVHWFSELLNQEQALLLSNSENTAMGISLSLSFSEKKA